MLAVLYVKRLVAVAAAVGALVRAAVAVAVGLVRARRLVGVVVAFAPVARPLRVPKRKAKPPPKPTPPFVARRATLAKPWHKNALPRRQRLLAVVARQRPFCAQTAVKRRVGMGTKRQAEALVVRQQV